MTTAPAKDQFPITAEANISIEVATDSKPFQDWLASVDRKSFDIRGVHIQSLDMFGTRAGFIKFKADVVDPRGKLLSGIVFMRGGSVAILPVLDCDGDFYSVLTVQPRLPTGSFAFSEIPAGMLDGSGNFAGVAARELDEELGITICESNLIDMSSLAGHSRGMYVSPGGTDETIRLFAFHKHVTRRELSAMNGKATGVLSEGEQICVKIVPLNDLWQVPDAKTISAIAIYKHLLSTGKITRT